MVLRIIIPGQETSIHFFIFSKHIHLSTTYSWASLQETLGPARFPLDSTIFGFVSLQHGYGLSHGGILCLQRSQDLLDSRDLIGPLSHRLHPLLHIFVPSILVIELGLQGSVRSS